MSQHAGSIYLTQETHHITVSPHGLARLVLETLLDS
jgi:hypothetical protein